jgi:N-acylglucosamine 2-epimerase
MFANQPAFAEKNLIAQYSELYKNELIQHILPFWLQNSKDEANGGYFTCLDATGMVYDTDKFMWLQGRQVWCFDYMYTHVEQRQEWLDFALTYERN